MDPFDRQLRKWSIRGQYRETSPCKRKAGLHLKQLVRPDLIELGQALSIVSSDFREGPNQKAISGGLHDLHLQERPELLRNLKLEPGQDGRIAAGSSVVKPLALDQIFHELDGTLPEGFALNSRRIGRCPQALRSQLNQADPGTEDPRGCEKVSHEHWTTDARRILASKLFLTMR